MPSDSVILVDSSDREIGVMEKLAAHQNGGALHRAFSIFLFDPQGRWILQRRAAAKYHFPLLWTNTCCSHPAPGESTPDAAHRRLREELGMDCPLIERFHFVYRATSTATGLTEHEFDHVFTGRYDAPFHPDPREVDAIRALPTDALCAEVAAHPEHFTPWFKLAMTRLLQNGQPEFPV